MQASYWTYTELVKLTAKELTQLIKNLEDKQRTSSGATATVIAAAVKRAKFVLYAVGNLMAEDVEVKTQRAPWEPPDLQPKFERKQQFTEAQLLAIVDLHRLLRSKKFTAQKQGLLEAISSLSHSRTKRVKHATSAANPDIEGEFASFWKHAA